MIRVRVPATSANMGPGFDAIGVALNLYNEYAFEEIENGLEFFGIEKEFCNEDNIIYKAMIECFKKRNYKIKGLRISILKNEIPISRGLGSSSSCIVGGIIGANEIMGQKLSTEELLELAVSMEGHPDNVVPALLGGIVVAIVIKGKVIYDKVKAKNDLNFIPIIPDFKLSTEKARKVLPNKISFEDGVYNVGRAALMVTALNNGSYNLLKFACDDRFHEIYRGNLIKGFDIIKKESYNNGALASFLSGAGPTIMTIINRKNSFSNKMREVLDREGVNYSILTLSIDNEGAVVIEGGNK
ncbi:homoserine kinase [Clostridium sardiniense]|uniref:Homoserine kinase n=1 Tax=Clostridium sardiniense TaxID=29369 RepID=A0ABS7KWN9_CLOSR|nr:homoserine kinase [Clostridium sardiniense]MBY0755229.1 homoserine kinase [Clostridium sardiniense]MDQ0459672.1 homoserine kinase [Clostridium sardiniense]